MKLLAAIIAVFLAATSINALALVPRTNDFSSSEFEFPHLILNVDSNDPNKAPGSSFSSNVTPTISTIFKFDIPTSRTDKTCSLTLILPNDPSVFTLTTPNKIGFSQLDGGVSTGTTWNNKPPELANFGTQTLQPGNSYPIHTFPCPVGQELSYMTDSVDGTLLNYFQNSGGSNP
ncbi:MAG: hypothetical protein M1840_006424 [Geoglossum simile]|nr:MAG: hypothetical protein M1840_006424 [Geoglossum simile]